MLGFSDPGNTAYSDDAELEHNDDRDEPERDHAAGFALAGVHPANEQRNYQRWRDINQRFKKMKVVHTRSRLVLEEYRRNAADA